MKEKQKNREYLVQNEILQQWWYKKKQEIFSLIRIKNLFLLDSDHVQRYGKPDVASHISEKE